MSIDLGFETIGNATCTVYDGSNPILTTDPWVIGKPYFGSWTHRYKIPEDKKSNIFNAKYVWISHGHPDHLDIESLNNFKNAYILLSDHYNNRIYNDLLDLNYNVKIIKSNVDYQLSKNISIKCFADFYQDSIIIINIADKDLIVNLNDSNLFGIKEVIKKEINRHNRCKNKFLLKAIGLYDADMVNFYDSNNNFILEKHLTVNNKTGKTWSDSMRELGCNYGIIFSSMHKYQRSDSVHLNKYTKPLKTHWHLFDNTIGELLPPFIIWDSIKDDYTMIDPDETKSQIISSEYYGDSWSDTLDNNDKKLLLDYFNKLETIKPYIGIIHFNCGGDLYSIEISKIKNEIIFEVPRNSLMKAIRFSIFDDLLIGNFMRTRLINLDSLYPNFAPLVTKYYDNGMIYNFEDLKNYHKYYKSISGSDYLYYKDVAKRRLKDAYKGSSLELFYYYSSRVYYHIFNKNIT